LETTEVDGVGGGQIIYCFRKFCLFHWFHWC